MSGGISEGGLRWRTVSDASSGEVVCELARVARVDAEPTAVLSVGALSAPKHAAAIDIIPVVIDSWSAVETRTLHHAEIGGVVAELSESAGVNAYSRVDISVALRI